MVVVGLVVGVWVGVGWLKVAVLICFAGILFACSLICVCEFPVVCVLPLFSFTACLVVFGCGG